MGISMDFMISLFILFMLVSFLYSILNYSNSTFYVPALNQNILTHKAYYNSLFVTLNSYSIKKGINNDDYDIDCVISNNIYCKDDELNITGSAPIYLRRGGGN